MIHVDDRLAAGQAKFIFARTTYNVLCAGRGYGKTHAAAKRSVLLSRYERHQLVTARTFRELRQTVMPRFQECLELYHIPYKSNAEDHVIMTDRAKFLFLSCEDPESIRSYTDYSDLFMDEASRVKRAAFKNAVLCCRGGCVRPTYNFMTTPCGGSWFNKMCKSRRDDITFVKASSLDNDCISEDTKKSFIDVLSDTPELMREEIYADLLDESPINAVIPDECFDYPHRLSSRLPVNFGIDFAGEGTDDTVVVCANSTGFVSCSHFGKMPGDLVYLKFLKMAEGLEVLNLDLDNTGGYASAFIASAGNGPYRDCIRPDNFAASPLYDQACANRRADIYFRFRNVMNGGYDTSCTRMVRDEMPSVTYFLNQSGKKQIIDKKLIRKDLGHSPDESDACGLAVYRGFGRPAEYEPVPIQRFS